jgi:hypothetical protein
MKSPGKIERMKFQGSFLRTLLAAFAAFLFMTTPNASAENITLPNLDWSQQIEPWKLRGQGKPAFDENFRAAQTPAGGAALEFSLTPSTAKYLQRSMEAERRDLPTAAGFYRLRFGMQTELVAGFAYPQIFVEKRDGSHLEIVAPETVAGLRISGQTPWREYSLCYELPADVSVTRLSFKVDLGMGRAAFANVRLEKLEEKVGRALLANGAQMEAEADAKTLFYQDDFERENDDWFQDGTARCWRANGKLFVDCLPGKTSGMWTLWLKKPLSGDFYIAYDAMCLEPEVWNNLNFFLLGRTLDGKLPAPGQFDSSYGQYHEKAQTYIGTFTYKWSRMRKDPGFHLISDDQNKVAHVNQKYFFEIIKRGPQIEWRIDGQTAHRITDENPYQSGLFALRSADTKFWVDNFQIYTLAE